MSIDKANDNDDFIQTDENDDGSDPEDKFNQKQREVYQNSYINKKSN